MARPFLISVFCPDRTGLVAAVTGRLFDLGANLGDTTFAVLGDASEFSTVCTLPDSVAPGQVASELRALPELAGATITVSPFALSPEPPPNTLVTHRITLRGGDQPGLIARVTEALVGFNANIVRLEARRIPGSASADYETRIAVWLPAEKAEACLTTIANTAGPLELKCSWDKV